MDVSFTAHHETPEPARVSRSRASDWLWRPWYAKFWWTSIPVWWLGLAASTHIPMLESFYGSALVGFMNILFFPMTALMVLGVGYVQEWLAQFPMSRDGEPLFDEAAAAVAHLEAEDLLALEEFKASTDIYDPRSGGLYIGNPLSPQNPHHRF